MSTVGYLSKFCIRPVHAITLFILRTLINSEYKEHFQFVDNPQSKSNTSFNCSSDQIQDKSVKVYASAPGLCITTLKDAVNCSRLLLCNRLQQKILCRLNPLRFSAGVQGVPYEHTSSSRPRPGHWLFLDSFPGLVKQCHSRPCEVLVDEHGRT